MNVRFVWLKQTVATLRDWLDPLSKVATIVAVVIAGIWTYHIHTITGESEGNPELAVSTQMFDYSNDQKILLVRIRERNVGKVPILLDPNALHLTVTRVPNGLKLGYIDIHKQPATYEQRAFLARYDEGDDLEPGAELRDIAEFVVPSGPGLYHIEAALTLPDGDLVNDETLQSVP